MSESIRVASSLELKEKPLCIEHEGVPYIIFRAEKKIRAFVSVCSHENLAMFPPKFKKGCLICPYHKVSFDPDSGQVVNDRGKKVSALPKVDVEVIDGAIYLHAKKKHRKMLTKNERRWVKKESGKKVNEKKGEE